MAKGHTQKRGGKAEPVPPTGSEIVLYQTEDERTRLEVRLENEMVWLTQKLMSALFQKDVRTVNEYIQNFFTEGELQRGQLSGNSG